ncbi:MAG: SDR family oxidoreductase [Syntrophobacterales bacterium]|nr:MAG: SDR family oxidoreductase [Syntrophobacterales bacterium]
MNGYLVTGGAGFIGSHLVEYLQKRGEKVRVLDNFSTGKMENIEPFVDRVDLITGDVRDRKACEEAVKGIDFILHQAAVCSVPRSIEDPVSTNETNIGGTLNLLIAARDAHVKRFICASSSSVYGESEILPKVETMSPNPSSPYGVTKQVKESYCKVFYKIYELETVCLRYFNVYGSKQDPYSQYSAVIPSFVRCLLMDEPPTIYGDGEQTRDFTYVSDCVQANWKACHAKGIGGGVFNIATGKRISINQLYRELLNALGKEISPIYASPRQGDIKHSLADITMAKAKMKFSPHFDIGSGLRECLRWYRKHFSDKRSE